MLNKLIKLLGGYTKTEYTALVNEKSKLQDDLDADDRYIKTQAKELDDIAAEMGELNSTIAELNQKVKAQEETIAKLKTGATKFTICVDGGKVWIE